LKPGSPEYQGKEFGRQALSQLTVFASAPVETAVTCMFPIVLFLAADTQTDARDSQAPGLWNRLPAFFTISQSFTAWQPAACMLDRIFDTGVNLFLHGAIACPTSGHDVLPVALVQMRCAPDIFPLLSSIGRENVMVDAAHR